MSSNEKSSVYGIDGEKIGEVTICGHVEKDHLFKIGENYYKVDRIIHTTNGFEYLVSRWQFQNGSYS